MVKFWHHCILSRSPILVASMALSRQLCISGVKSWFFHLRKVLDLFNIAHILYTSDYTEIKFQMVKLKKTANNSYKNAWNAKYNTINKDGKYAIFSKIFYPHKRPNYLNYSLFPKYRNGLFHFRTGVHLLPVETGRYHSMPKEDRLCPFCNRGTGDEVHYILKCEYEPFKKCREIMVSDIKNPNFAASDIYQQIGYLLNCDSLPLLNSVARLLFTVESYFKECV